ncbi:retrovirus-related pol polyprotein from transposon TNT 1-94 [Tanacetum coccineum]
MTPHHVLCTSAIFNLVEQETVEKDETLKSTSKIVTFSDKVKRRIAEEQEKMFLKGLGMGNPKPIKMVIEMVDKSMQSSKGIIENVLVKIDKFIFLVDFVIMYNVEDGKVPIILVRPMLATAHAWIDVFVPYDFGEQENLEEFLINDDLNGNLGDFLEIKELLLKKNGDPFGVLLDS